MLKKLCFLFFIVQFVNATHIPFIKQMNLVKGEYINPEGKHIKLPCRRITVDILDPCQPYNMHIEQVDDYTNSDFFIEAVFLNEIKISRSATRDQRADMVKLFALACKAQRGDFDALSASIHLIMPAINAFLSIDMLEDAADMFIETYKKFSGTIQFDRIMDISHTLGMQHKLRHAIRNGENAHKIVVDALRKFKEEKNTHLTYSEPFHESYKKRKVGRPYETAFLIK